MLPTNPSTIAIHSLLRFGFPIPTTPSPIWFRDISSDFRLGQGLQRIVTVISLVRHASRAVGLYPLAYFCVVRDASYFGNVFARLWQGFLYGLGVPSRAAGATTAPVFKSTACSAL